MPHHTVKSLRQAAASVTIKQWGTLYSTWKLTLWVVILNKSCCNHGFGPFPFFTDDNPGGQIVQMLCSGNQHMFHQLNAGTIWLRGQLHMKTYPSRCWAGWEGFNWNGEDFLSFVSSLFVCKRNQILLIKKQQCEITKYEPIQTSQVPDQIGIFQNMSTYSFG